VVSYNITDPVEKDRSCGIMKITVKEKVNLSFDITANASNNNLQSFHPLPREYHLVATCLAAQTAKGVCVQQ